MIGKRWYAEPDTADQQIAAQRSRAAAGRQDRDRGRPGRRAWRPGAGRRQRMDRARRTRRRPASGSDYRGRRQLPEGRAQPVDCREPKYRSNSVIGPLLSRREALAGLGAVGAASALLGGCAAASPASRKPLRARPTPRRCSIRSPRICSDCRPRSATSLGIDKGARAPLCVAADGPLRRRPGADRGNAPRRPCPRRSDRHRRARAIRPGPASRSCESAYRTALEGLPCPMATSPSAAGATRPMSSSRMSAPISTCRASSTADHHDRQCRRCRGLSRAARQLSRPSSTARLGRITRRPRAGRRSRPPSCSTRRSRR